MAIPHTPQIDCRSICALSQEELWRPIPSSYNAVSVITAGFPSTTAGDRNLFLKFPGKTEIGDLQYATVVNKQICGYCILLAAFVVYNSLAVRTFHVAMEDFVLWLNRPVS